VLLFCKVVVYRWLGIFASVGVSISYWLANCPSLAVYLWRLSKAAPLKVSSESCLCRKWLQLMLACGHRCRVKLMAVCIMERLGVCVGLGTQLRQWVSSQYNH
jgi:predicted RND superfamily exporter protein